MAKVVDDDKELSFEEGLEQLETMISQLEDGDIPLNELVSQYEKGTKLLNLCRAHLQSAEKKIEILSESTGDLVSFKTPE